jgi:hypothetical protein
MQIYLAATPEDAKSASSYGYPLAHMAYYKSFEQHSQSGGRMILSDYLTSAYKPEDIIDECKRRNFDGIILAFEGGDKLALLEYAYQLDELCAQHNITLISSKKFQTSKSLMLVSSGAVSGSLKQRLDKYGSGSVLEVVRLSQDIPLPAPHDRGMTMTRKQLNELLQTLKPVTFFSSELLARYFTYKDKDGVTHFIIYDDAESITKKLRLAEAMGFSSAVMLFSEVKDLLSDIG